MKKVVLAYSGGLDTSFCVKYLGQELGYEVHAALVQTGGFLPEELAQIETRAKMLGVANYTCLDATSKYYQEVVRYLIAGNVLKNNTYPLSVSAERIAQAKAIAEYAIEIGADAIAHGSTGAGNDQVRFDLAFQILCPGLELIAPIRSLSLSRQTEIDYLIEKGVVQDWSKAKYSVNKGLWGTSVGGAETLTSHQYLPEEAWPTPKTASKEQDITIEFEKGEPVGIGGQSLGPIETIRSLQALAQPYGIGRDIHVGDTIIGIKGRVGFEAAAPLIIVKAHHLLEKHTLSKTQLHLKETLGSQYGTLLHEGQYLEPAMRDLEVYLESTQAKVTGSVGVRLMPNHFVLLGIRSPYDLHATKHGSYGEANLAWTGQDVQGFTKIMSISTTISRQVASSATTPESTGQPA